MGSPLIAAKATMDPNIAVVESLSPQNDMLLAIIQAQYNKEKLLKICLGASEVQGQFSLGRMCSI